MPIIRIIKNLILGKAKNPQDKNIFHHLSLIAFFAWVGLGADGLSSSCYGPEEAFLALHDYPYLSLFVALGTALTVIVISAGYAQIIEVFPRGGGGYLVASKLLSPNLGMISGCALLIDYVLTIAISIASSTDALFSFFPQEWLSFKLYLGIFGIFILTLLNMRGVKESVLPLVPIFITFLITHAFTIIYALVKNAGNYSQIAQSTATDVQTATGNLGFIGMMFIILRAYSMGAGTYTGIEAVSNGLSILREPRVITGKKTMQYMSISLAFTVMGLMIAYLLLHVSHVPGKTLNAVLFESVTQDWAVPWGHLFVLAALFSEATLLFVAAQAGFLGGPAVLANMALDRWFPTKFAMLSDRLVTQNGVMLMGTAALLTLIFTHGSVHLLVVLYSINVFITFFFSQAGMVRHWWNERKIVPDWRPRILINGTSLLLTTFILISVTILKFHSGGWVTLLITGALVSVAVIIKRHYAHTAKLLNRLNSLVDTAVLTMKESGMAKGVNADFDANSKTAVLLVNGFNGLGLHTLFNVFRFFGKEFRNFIFIEIGVIDAGNFKGTEAVDQLREQVKTDVARYVDFVRHNGYYAEGLSFVGIDVIGEIEKISLDILQKHPGVVFFGGQLVFPEESLLTRWLHNYTVFSMQRRFYQKGIPFVILPIRV